MTAIPSLPSQWRLAALALLLGLAAILGAHGSEFIGGLVPCELCYEQRQPYYWGLPVLAVVVLFWPRLPKIIRIAGLAVTLAAFVWGAWLGGYHAGVEWGWWPGPASCTGVGDAIDFSALDSLDATRIVPCDVVQFRFLGLSLAGYNFLVSLAIAVLMAAALILEGRSRGRAGPQGSSSISQ